MSTEACAEFLEEYQWLRSFGWGNAAIARRLGLSEPALEKRLSRAGVLKERLSPDREVAARLRALIDGGQVFDSWSFPLSCDPTQVVGALALAARRGLIVKVGVRQGPLGYGTRTGIYQQSAAAAAEAAGIGRMVA